MRNNTSLYWRASSNDNQVARIATAVSTCHLLTKRRKKGTQSGGYSSYLDTISIGKLKTLQLPRLKRNMGNRELPSFYC